MSACDCADHRGRGDKIKSGSYSCVVLCVHILTSMRKSVHKFRCQPNSKRLLITRYRCITVLKKTLVVIKFGEEGLHES